MFSANRTFEILLFAFCNFAPYILLSLYAFSKHFRFSKLATCLVCLLLMGVQFSTRYWSASYGINTSIAMSIIRLIVFMAGYAILFDQRFGKVLFLELIFANIGNFILIAAVCIERNMFPQISHRLYCWHSSVVMILLHLLTTLPLVFAIKKYYKPMLENKWVGKQWNYYWIVPSIFYIIWQYQINGGTQTGLENIENPDNVVFLFIINIGSILIYYLMLQLDGQLARNLELEVQHHYQDIERLEYQVLHERMEETRRIRHDLRHHIHTMSHYLEEKQYDRLQKYLDTYRSTIPDGQAIRFCQHRTINSLILYFASQAREHQIDFSVQLLIPEDTPVDEHDISVLLGNLLENAVEACAEQQNSTRRIIIKGNGDQHSLIFTIDNTCENEIKKNKKGEFLTTKRTGNGIGMNSAKKIVERYNGVFSADKKGDMFYVSFMLNL